MSQQRSVDGRCHDGNLSPELSLTSDGAIYRAPYLDLDLEIRDGKIHTKLYDKRDAFGFEIVNYPDLSGNIPEKQSYGVFRLK